MRNEIGMDLVQNYPNILRLIYGYTVIRTLFIYVIYAINVNYVWSYNV